MVFVKSTHRHKSQLFVHNDAHFSQTLQGTDIFCDNDIILQVFFVQALKTAQLIPKHGAALNHIKSAGQINPDKNPCNLTAPYFGIILILEAVELFALS